MSLFRITWASERRVEDRRKGMRVLRCILVVREDDVLLESNVLLPYSTEWRVLLYGIRGDGLRVIFITAKGDVAAVTSDISA
jgi:hypothetical protein